MEGNSNKVAIWVVVIIIVIAAIWLIVKSTGSKEPTNTDTNTTAQTSEPIKIGFIGPLTGELANMGAATKAAVEISADEINSAGGVSGRQVQVIYEDDQCTPTLAANAVTKLINTDKVVAIVGGLCSGPTLSAAPIAEAAKVPMMAYSATAPKISEAGDYIFRNVPSDLFQAKFAADYIYNKLGKHNVAVVYLNNDWGVGLSGSFTKAFTDLGGKIVSTDAYDPTSTDLRSQMTKVKSSKAELLYFPAFTEGSIAGIKQAKEIGLKIPMFGADAWDDGKTWSELGATGEGAMYTVIDSKGSDDFKAKMAAEVGPDNLPYSAPYAYDVLKVYAKVIGEVGTDGTAIKDALYKVNYTGGVGVDPLSFDANGDPVTANYVVKVVKDGKAEVMTQ